MNPSPAFRFNENSFYLYSLTFLTPYLSQGGTRTAAFNIRDFLNEEEDQFVTVMSSNRLNSARTHFSWANPSPAARGALEKKIPDCL